MFCLSSKEYNFWLKIALIASVAVLIASASAFALLMIGRSSKKPPKTTEESADHTSTIADGGTGKGDLISDPAKDSADSPPESDPAQSDAVSDTSDDTSDFPDLKPGAEYVIYPAFDGISSAELPQVISELYTLGIRSTYKYEYSENEKNTVFGVNFMGAEKDGEYYIEKGSEVLITLSAGPENGNDIPIELRTVYFTFDDGPSAETDEVLAILDRYNIKATFFTIGQIVKARPDNLRKIYNAGHVIACHSYSHIINPNTGGYIYESPSALEAEIKEWENEVSAALGFFPENSRLFRFPGGSSKVPAEDRAAFKNKLTALGYRGYDWSFANCDAWPGGNKNNLPTDEYLREMFKTTLDRAKNKTKICLMHDRIEASRDQLEEEIQYLIANGYVFDTIDHLETDWYSTK